MSGLQTLPATASTDEILGIVSRDGAVILSDVLNLADIEQFRAELEPYIQATEVGRDRFAGERQLEPALLLHARRKPGTW